ncbi:hypothetical protein F8M49_01185 [Rhodococcus zopfii]|uniref:Secreted protein n=1 Tax=Rhodococcus zopfii TaxID=43772 RepID=A0ABU3WK64_9NOCA|nr:hypothetical protein [Rhodococcus zopfii]
MRFGRGVAAAAAVVGALMAPVAFGITVGAGTARAESWQLGPLYRYEFTGVGAEYFCSKSTAQARAARAIELVPCTLDPATGSWYRIAIDTYGLAPQGLGSSS